MSAMRFTPVTDRFAFGFLACVCLASKLLSPSCSIESSVLEGSHTTLDSTWSRTELAVVFRVVTFSRLMDAPESWVFNDGS